MAATWFDARRDSRTSGVVSLGSGESGAVGASDMVQLSQIEWCEARGNEDSRGTAHSVFALADKPPVAHSALFYRRKSFSGEADRFV